MSTFAPDEAMSNPGNHPPLEELAAYIDGMLGEEEAARVAEHISECEDCFFVYSETVRFQLEHPSEKEDPAPNVVPFPRKAEEVPAPDRQAVAGKRKRAFPRWLGIAAAAVAVAVGIPLYRSLSPQNMPEMTTAELLGPVQEVPYNEEQLYDYRVFRSANEESEVSPEIAQTSVMSGALLFDLRRSLQGGDVKSSEELLKTVGRAIADVDIPPSNGDLLIQEATRLSSPADLQRIPPEVDKWEAEIRAGNWIVDPDYFTFGQWVEAGRLAAVHQKPDFFQDRANRRVLSYVLGSEDMAPDEEVVKNLQEIERIWDKGDLQPQDFTALAEKFEAILRAYDFTA